MEMDISTENYQKLSRKRIFVLCVLGIFMFLAGIADILIGASSLSPLDAIGIIFSGPSLRGKYHAIIAFSSGWKGINDTKSIILIGVVITFFFQAMQSLLQYMASQNQMSEILHWLFGVMMLLVSSIIAKLVKPGVIIPVGIVTNLVGASFLAYLILRKKTS